MTISRVSLLLARRAICAAAIGAALLAPAALAQSGGKAPASADAKATPKAMDRVTLRSGKIVEGFILSESDKEIRMQVIDGGIRAELQYMRDDILVIEKGAVPVAADAKASASPTAAPKDEATPVDPSAPKVYRMVLDGQFARDITQTPIRNMVRDAKNLGAQYLIVELNNDWSEDGFARKDEESEYNFIFRSEKIEPALTEEIEREWAAPPKVIFWVRNAMGGAAFLPLSCKNIYFSSSAKMGGIGRIEDFTRAQDQVVQEKWISAGLGHIEGMAIKGGYDTRLVRAMVRTSYVLSYKIEGGQPVLLERMPEGPDEVLLTDNGDGDNKDNDRQLARGEGNDVLTLNADLAFKLGVSKGTVDSYEDLLVQLGIGRNYTELKGRAEQINKGWKRDIAQAERELPRLWREFNEIQPRPPAGLPERTEARSRQISRINEMQALLKKYEEAIVPGRLGIPNWNWLETRKKQLQIDNQRDRIENQPGGGAGGGGGRSGGGGGGG